jgi:hypothetical protein
VSDEPSCRNPSSPAADRRRDEQDRDAWPVELAPAARRLRVLVLGIRPSIARRCGLPAIGSDRLDDDGVNGWQVGVRQLATDLATLDVPVGAAAAATWLGFSQWCRDELAAEPLRWRSADGCGDDAPPLVAVEHVQLLRAALGAPDPVGASVVPPSSRADR